MKHFAFSASNAVYSSLQKPTLQSTPTVAFHLIIAIYIQQFWVAQMVTIAKHDPCLIKASLSSTQVIQTEKQLNAKLHVY